MADSTTTMSAGAAAAAAAAAAPNGDAALPAEDVGHAATANGDEKQHVRRGSTSYLSYEEQQALERKLINRPTRDDLAKHNILKDGGALAAAKSGLEKQMTHDAVARALDSRPDIHVLENRHVVQGADVAPRLRSTKIQLEHAITRDHLGHLLESRPEPDELIQHNIMQPVPIASRIQSVSKKLQHNLTKDRVAHQLEKRQDLESLQNQNIIDENTTRVAPSLQAAQRSLQRNLAKANLYHALKRRPERTVLEQKGIIHPDDAGKQQRAYEQKYEPAAPQTNQDASSTPYQRRSKNFHLTRILLRSVANMAEMGEISLKQKGFLKDLIVDQDATILLIAEQFDASTDYAEFQEALIRLAQSDDS